MQQRLAHVELYQAIHRPCELRAELGLHVDDRGRRLRDDLVAGPLPLLLDRGRRGKAHGRSGDVELAGERLHHADVIVGDEFEEDLVQRRAAEEVVVEAKQVHLGAGLDAIDAVWPESDVVSAHVGCVQQGLLIRAIRLG